MPLGRLTFVVLLALTVSSAALMLTRIQTPPDTTAASSLAPADPINPDDLSTAARPVYTYLQANDTAPVIVLLAVDNEQPPTFMTDEQKAAYEASIADAQAQVRDSLSSDAATVTQRYSHVPLMTLTINEQGLRDLTAQTHVAAIYLATSDTISADPIALDDLDDDERDLYTQLQERGSVSVIVSLAVQRDFLVMQHEIITSLSETSDPSPIADERWLSIRIDNDADLWTLLRHPNVRDVSLNGVNPVN